MTVPRSDSRLVGSQQGFEDHEDRYAVRGMPHDSTDMSHGARVIKYGDVSTFRNILTDGQRLYPGDLGLATSTRFDLSTDESDFVAQNMSHDTCYTVMELVNWLVTNIVGVAVPATGGPVDRNEYIRRCAAGAEPAEVPAPVSAIISRYAPVAIIMNDFYWNLFGESRATPYPAQEIALVPGSASAPP